MILSGLWRRPVPKTCFTHNNASTENVQTPLLQKNTLTLDRGECEWGGAKRCSDPETVFDFGRPSGYFDGAVGGLS